ncbi:RWD domain-containing protein, putative [Plasmodium vinckei brucechwatti]|uniref:RWD domain-containing protein, putative n=1 Tax=Plasmodium vinckei brucechwatti TaxID=119398 RepID=A0A6V7SCX4_PLAVN|nr:RWD domain-containing protein, putative [Plasmodium vinckei brucechwatti]
MFRYNNPKKCIKFNEEEKKYNSNKPKGPKENNNIGKSNTNFIKNSENKTNCSEQNTKGIDKEILLKCEELQKQELEALKLIYVGDRELIIKNEQNKERDTIIYMELNDENDHCNNVINITIELPKDYPLKSFIIININVKNFTADMNNYINQEIYKDIQNYLEQECIILNVIYKINELVEKLQNNKDTLAEKNNTSSAYSSSDEDKIDEDYLNNNIDIQNSNSNITHSQDNSFLYYNKMSFGKRVLARRLCYSHHILSQVKRSCIIKWARELKIGGYSKIGYPGIIVCEGPKEEVDFYVNSLNKLRWKHFDCRGMEDIVLNEYEHLDDMRVLPKNMYELDQKSMSTLSNICTECGLRDLFLTSMKIYGARNNELANEQKEVTEKDKSDNNKKKKKKK